MSPAIKIAITLPREDYRALEQIRKSQGESRSGVILMALKHWFECAKKKALIRQYQQGYLKYPEDSLAGNIAGNIAGNVEREALERTQMDILQPKDWP